MIAQNFNVGSNVEYQCDEGHLLVGPSIRTCLDTGFYNEFPPVCKRIQCGYPADIVNGEYHLTNGSVGYLSHVVYNCHDGYEMIGRAQLICDIDERWNGPPPRCERKFTSQFFPLLFQYCGKHLTSKRCMSSKSKFNYTIFISFYNI